MSLLSAPRAEWRRSTLFHRCQHFQASFSLLMRLHQFAAQIVRIGFCHRLRVKVFARAIYIINENALSSHSGEFRFPRWNLDSLSHLVTIHVVPGLSMGRRQRKQGVGNGQADNPGNAEPESPTLQLVRRIQEEAPYGTTAFRELVERYNGMVFGRAFRLVGSAEDAEEVVQDVFLRVFRSIKRFRPEQPLDHWLFTITTNSARNLLRARFREARRRAEYGDFLRASVPVRRPAGSRQSAVIERAMASLDPTTRMAIALRFLEEQTYHEISAQLGLGESAVKMRVRRGLDQLRKRLSEDA